MVINYGNKKELDYSQKSYHGPQNHIIIGKSTFYHKSNSKT